MEPTLFQERTKLLKKKNDERKKFWDDRDAKIAEARKTDPNYADTELSSDDKKFLDKLHGEIKDLTAEVEGFNEWSTIAGKAEAMSTVLGQPKGRPDYGNTEPKPQTEKKSIGRQFVESDAFKRLMNNLMPEGVNNGSIPDQMKIHSDAFEAKGLIYSAATSGGAFVRREYAESEFLPLRPLTIRQLITNSRTGSNLIEFVRQTAKTRAADVIPEATATSGGGYTAAAKPEAGMEFEIVQVGVKTIPVWMPITRQILQDAPQLESEINSFLVDDIELKFEEEIISGTGGTHFTGLENTTGLTPQAYFNDGVSAASSRLATARKARTTTQIVARDIATGFLMNPLDWESFDLTKDAENRYYFGGPLTLGTKMLWGLPVAESEVIPQGTMYTGNLRKIQVWDRELPTLRVTDSHADFFTHNLIAILAEMRAAMGVKRPAAIVKVDLVEGANS